MDEPRPSLRGALTSVLSAHPSMTADRPLYEYRFTGDEYRRMGEALRANRRTFLSDPCGRALFVAYAAEWFRREREGGHWDWVHPLASLGVRYHATDPGVDVRYGDVRSAAEAGLAAWRRRPKSGLSPLYAVIAESGFPAAAIRQGPRLANWLKRAILGVEAGFTPEDAVRAEAWRAPEGLVQALFEPAVALCRSIVELRAGIPRDPGLDPVQLLDAGRPGWRAELPFDLEEQDVRRLVEDLVRAQREESHGLDVTRRLRKSDGGWVAHAELALSGALDHRKLPQELRTVLQDAGRVRLRPGGVLAEHGRVVAALERIQNEENDRWDVRPLIQGFDVRLALGEELRLQAIAGEGLLAEFTAFGGDPIDGPVLVLEPPDTEAIDDVAELDVLGASPARSPRPWLVLAAEPAVLAKVTIEGERRELGPECSSGRTLLAFRGRAELDLDGERFVWRSGDERRQALRLNLVGDTVRGIEERVFRGCPGAWLAEEDRAWAVSRSDLTWRSIGGSQWVSAARAAPLGRVELAVRRKGELVAWTRADVAPATFEMKPNSRAHALTLGGTAGALVAAVGNRPLPCQAVAVGTVVDLADLPRGAALKLRLRWTTIIEMTLPDPVTDPVLLDPAGRPAPHTRLAIGRLAGYRLLAPQRWTLLFELRRTGARPVYATRTIEGLVPLVAFTELIRQLLGGCEELDACVRLSWVGRENRIADIGWYDLDQPLTVAERSSPFAVLARSAHAPSLVAFSLVQPKPELARPELASAASMCAFLAEHAGQGPWLVAGETHEGRRLRPKVLGEAGGPAEHPLGAALRETSWQRRDAALDVRLAEPATLAPAELRLLVNLAMAAVRAEVPYASIDALRGLCRAPRAAVFVLAECSSFPETEAVLRLQGDLPMLWCASPVEDWIAAFTARRERLVKKLADVGEPAGGADTAIASALGRIVDLQPALSVHCQASLLLSGARGGAQGAVAERLQRPPRTDLPHLAQELIKRHGDGAEPPTSLGLAQLAGGDDELLRRHDPAFADVIAAPIVAADLALGKPAPPTALSSCRTAWLFDKDYFEAAVLGRLFARAQA
jgi:hypothetical protein